MIKVEKGKLALQVSTATFRNNMARVFRELEAGAVDMIYITNYGKVSKIITLPPDFQSERATTGPMDLSS